MLRLRSKNILEKKCVIIELTGNLDDLLGVEGGVIGSVVWLVDEDRVLHLVDLLLDGDNGSVDSLSSPEDGGDGDGEVGGGWLDDPGGVSGDVVGLSEVDLLGDDRSRLVDSGDSLSLAVGGEGGGGGRGHVVDGLVGHDGTSGVVLGPVGGHCSRSGGQGGGHQVCGGCQSTSQDKGKGHLQVGIESLCRLSPGALFYLQKVS